MTDRQTQLDEDSATIARSAALLREYMEKLSLGGNHPTMVVVPRVSLNNVLDKVEKHVN